jgi:hypothetical protein
MGTKAYNEVQRRLDICCSYSETYKSIARIQLVKADLEDLACSSDL